MTAMVYIALGTNLGDRMGYLQAAIDALPPKVKVVRLSPVYETPPWGILDQPDFLNQVLQAETDLPPEELLVYLKEIEKAIGRQSRVRYGPREIDIDILFYDQQVVDLPQLQIPHPRLHERSFVLVPLADLAADLRHPQSGKTVRELLQAVDTQGVKRYQPG